MEIISIVLISTYVTLGILYLINNQIFQNIYSNNDNQIETTQVSDREVYEILNELSKQINELNDEISLIKTNLKEIESQEPIKVAGAKGDPGEVPQEYLSKVDQIESKLNQQSLCVESMYQFFVTRNNWFIREYAEVDNSGRVKVDIWYIFNEDQFSC